MFPIALSLVVPLATKWVEEQQCRILAEGVPLTANQTRDAQLAGVKDPAKVRLLKVEFIPPPEDLILQKVNEQVRQVSSKTVGITFGYGIYIREDRWYDRALVVHELVHVGQYERFGSTEAFLRDYLSECVTIGYPNGPLEQEAVVRSKKICG